MKSKLFIENNTIKDISNLLFKKFKNNILLESSRKKHNQSINSYSFNDVSNYVDIYSNYFKKININRKDRVAIIVGNIPEFFILKIALNYNGISCVPLNYDLLSMVSPLLVVTLDVSPTAKLSLGRNSMMKSSTRSRRLSKSSVR